MKNIDVLEKYDYIICDLSPSYNLTAKNILYLAHSIIVPIMDKNLLKEEVPTTKKSTVVHETNDIKPYISIYDIVKKEKKKYKEQVGVTLDKEIVDKLKTVVIDSNINMYKLFENLLM